MYYCTLCENVPYRSQATQGNFQCHNDVGSLYTQETTTAQLKSHYCFPGCLVILTEDIVILSRV